MKQLVVSCAFLIAATACGRPTGPSDTPSDRFAILAPASRSADLAMMFTDEGARQWTQARSRLRGFQFYQQILRTSCPTCGPNSGPQLAQVTPGGAFTWLSQQGIQIGVEAGAVKEHTCDGRQSAMVALDDISVIYATGSHVTFLAMDEPFTAGLEDNGTDPLPNCGLSIDDTVVQVKAFVETMLAVHPEMRIGLIEPYPRFSIAQISSFIDALRNVGVRLPFFRLDLDLRLRRNTDANVDADLRQLRGFLDSRGMAFEVIVTGYDGETDAGAVASAMALAYEVAGAVGRPFGAVFQDWSSDRSGAPTNAVNLPESQVGSLTWLLNNGVDVFR